MSKINLLGNVDNTTNLVSSATKTNTTTPKGPKLDLFGGIKSATKAAELGELPTWDASGDLFKRYNNLDLDKYKKYFTVDGQVEIPAVNLDALNEGRARHQSTLAQIGNGLGKAGVTFVSAVGENTIGLVNGTLSALYNWDISKLYDNNVSRVFQGMQDWSQEAMPNYNTREMEHAGFFEQMFNPGKGVANFWADKFANGFAYTLASVATIIATGGYGSVGVAGNMTRMGLQAAAQTGRKLLFQAAKEATKKTVKKGIRTMFKEGMKRSGSTMGNIRQGVKDIAKGNLNRQALKTLDAGMSMAWAESSIEARDTYDTAYGSLVQQYMDENGFVDERQVPEDVKDKLKGEAQSASNVNFAANLAIVGTTDVLMFGRMINGYKPKIKFNPISGTGKAAVDATLIEGSKLSKMRRIWRNTKAYAGSAGTEMTQEGLQYVSNNAVTDYYLDKNADAGQADAVASIGNAFVDLFGTKEGKESLLLGFLTGGISTIRGTSRELAEQDARTETLINRVHKNFLKETRDKIERKEASGRYTYLMQQAEEEGDLEAFEEAHQALIQNEVVSAIQEGNIEHFKQRIEDAAEMTDEDFAATFGIDMESVKVDKASYISKLLKKVERSEEVFQEATQAFQTQERKGLYRWATEKLAPEELQNMEIKNENMKIFRAQYFNSVMQMDNLDAKEKENADLLSELTNGDINYTGMRDLIETTEQEEALNDRMSDVARRINENLDDAGQPVDAELNGQLQFEFQALQEQRAKLLDALSTQHEKTLKGQFDKQFKAWESKVEKQKGRVDTIDKARKAKMEIDYARNLRNQAVQAFNALKTEDGRTTLLQDIGRVEKLRRNDRHSGVLMREAKEMGMTQENYLKLYQMSQMPGLNENARKAIRKKQADLMKMEKRYRTMFRNMSEEQLAEAFRKYSNAYIKQLIIDEFTTRAKEAAIERDEERQRIEKEQEEQRERDQREKDEKENREVQIKKREKDLRDKPETDKNIDDVEVITHTDPKLQELDQKIAELEKLIEAEQDFVTPEADRITALDETLVGKDRDFVDLMREKGKSEELINNKIKSAARNTAQGNQLLQRYKAEDTLLNPKGKKFADLVSAHSLVFGENFIPSRTISDLLYSYPDLRTLPLASDIARYKEQQAILAYEAYASRPETLANLRGQRIAIVAQNQSKKETVPKNPANETGRKKGQVISRSGEYINKEPNDYSAKFDENLNPTNHRDSVIVNGQTLYIHRELLTDPHEGEVGTEVTLRVLPTDEWKKLASDTDTAEHKYPEYSTIPVGIYIQIEDADVLVGTLGYHQGNAEFTAERQRIYNNWKAGRDTRAIIKKYETDNLGIQSAPGYSSSKAVGNNDIQNYRNEDGLGVQLAPSELMALSEQGYGQPVLAVVTGHPRSDEGPSISLGLNAPELNVGDIAVPKSAIRGSVGMIVQDPNGYDLFIPMQTRFLSDNAIDVILQSAVGNKVQDIESIVYASYNVSDLIEEGYKGSTIPVNASSGLANNYYQILAKKDSEGNFVDSTSVFYTPYKDSMILVGANSKDIQNGKPVKMYEITDDGGLKVVSPEHQPAGLPLAENALRDMLNRKRYQVDASLFNNTNLQYKSPVTGITYDNYQKYLQSEQETTNEKGEVQPRRNGAPGSSAAIIASDVYVRKIERPLAGPHRSIHADVNIAMYLPELDNFKGKESNTDLADPITHNEVITEQQEKILEQQIADMLNIPNFDPSQIDFSGGVIPGATDLGKIEDDIVNKEANRFKKEQESKEVDPIKTNETKSETTADDVLDNDIDDIPDSNQEDDGIVGNQKKC